MHKQQLNRLSAPLLLALAALLPVTALAGGKAVIQKSGGSSKPVFWQEDGRLRLGSPDASEYSIIRDGAFYHVTVKNGKTMVINLASMFRMFNAMSGQSTPESVIQSIKATGETETVAGIEGRVYLITTTTPRGKTRTRHYVLTDHPLVVEMTRVFMRGLLSAFGVNVDKAMAALPEDDRGLLRIENEFQLVSISSADPAARLFKLPEQPTSFMQMMKKAFSGAMKKHAR